MNITVIGTGYVGLVTGACFSENGNKISCVDIDQSKIAALTDAKIPFYEPGLEELVRRNVKEGRLSFTSKLKESLENSSLAFICVGTPSAEDGSADLSYVFAAAREVAETAPPGLILITKSTVPVGTGDQVEAIMQECDRKDISVVSNPEFLREGSAVQDCLFPDRIVIGAEEEKVRETLQRIYQPFVRTGKPIFAMDRRSAEMTKYGANALLACRISFINEVSRLCEKVGANIDDVRKGMGADHRIGMQYLFPSVGFGGSCFPKDVRALQYLAKDHGMNPDLLNATLDGNERQKENFVQKLKNHFESKGGLSGKKVAVWGIAFKAKTDDIRESPALFVMDRLLEEGAFIKAFDPEAMPNAQEYYNGKIETSENMYEALEGCDALCVLTEWNEFRNPNFSRMTDAMNDKIVFDGRGLYNPAILKENGIKCISIGK